MNYNPYTGMTTCLSCKQCASDEFFSAQCEVASNSQCRPCGSCAFGQYKVGDCIQGTSQNRETSQPMICEECPLCPEGTFLSDGCVNNAPPICSNCSVCGGPAVLQCTALSDTVCPGVSDCRHNASLQVLPWLLPSHYCEQGEYLAGLSSTTGAPSCAQCPDGTYGNGLWCETCLGYKVAYFDATQCVCYEGTSPNALGNCDCRPGNEFLDDGCVPCAAGSYDNTLLELKVEWWTQSKACLPCPNGTDSLPGATACTACPFGMYREASESQVCRNCLESGYFATDPASRLSCVACNASCEPGYSPTPCPTYPGGDLFLCEPCAPRPANAASTAPPAATANTACTWECDAGFYQFNASVCAPCSAGPCDPGFNRSACTPLADSNCDTPCVDPNKPLRNSVWTSGCAWGCADGYELSAVDYVLWIQYSCVATGSQLFALWR